jgi:hypothetical protein
VQASHKGWGKKNVRRRTVERNRRAHAAGKPVSINKGPCQLAARWQTPLPPTQPS